jgi:hypothetical protein
MNVRHCTIALTALLLCGSLSNPAQAEELVDGTWSVNVSNNPASGTNWEINGVAIGGSLSAFSGVRRSADSSYLINGFGISRLLIGFNTSTTPSGNRSGFIFAFANTAGTTFADGQWTDQSGTFPFAGNLLVPSRAARR